MGAPRRRCGHLPRRHGWPRRHGRRHGRLHGRLRVPLDAGFGPNPVRALPRGKVGAIGVRAFLAWLAGTGGLEARTARAAVACPGRAKAPAPGPRGGGLRLRGGGLRPRGGGLGPRGEGASLAGIRRRRGAQEPSGGGCDARPGTVVGGRLFGIRLGGGPGRLAGSGRLDAGCGRLGVGLRLPRARNDQARRNGPCGHEVYWVIPAEQAGTLPNFLSRVLRRGPDVTAPTRLVTLCTHHRPQSRHTFPANTAVRRSSHFLVQTG